MNLRRFQKESESALRLVANGDSCATELLANVTPGGGKSILPIIAAQSLIPKKAEKLVWVVPRLNLASAAARAMSKHGIAIREADNDVNPSRGTLGYITTYQAITANPDLHRDELERYRYVLVLDEPHHIGDDGCWFNRIKPMWDMAVFRLMMSGTLERGSRDEIAFIEYRNGNPVLESTSQRIYVSYSRKEALIESAIVPVEFEHVDGEAAWISRDGVSKKTDSLARTQKEVVRDALFAAIQKGYATNLLEAALRHWRAYSAMRPWSQFLIVADSVASSKELSKHAQAFTGVQCVNATYDDPDSAATIRRFCAGERLMLSTCQMAYEGMDAPAITHVACLTTIRSKPWVEQMIARAVRTHPGKDRAWVFCPDDPLMNEVITAIRLEQASALREKKPEDADGGGDGGEPTDVIKGIIPVDSRLTQIRASELDGDATVSPRQMQWLKTKAPEALSNPLLIARVFRAAGSSIPEADLEPSKMNPTVSQEEDALRSKIESYCRKIDRITGRNFGKTNSEVRKHFDLSRELMTNSELKRVWAWLQSKYGSEVTT